MNIKDILNNLNNWATRNPGLLAILSIMFAIITILLSINIRPIKDIVVMFNFLKPIIPYVVSIEILFILYFYFSIKKQEKKIQGKDETISKLTQNIEQDKIRYEDKIGSIKDKNIQKAFNSVLNNILQEFTSSNISRGWKLYNANQQEIMNKIDSINNKLQAIRNIYFTMVKRENCDPDIFLNIHEEVYRSFKEINTILQPLKHVQLYDPIINNFKQAYKAYELWLVDYNKHINRIGYEYILW